ncbi:MAG TPA: kelch repeat-containing protein [Chthoniobacterales bacterium]|nr:kelch repeat-containing protein [Chthoniobacterales bacterium]
MTFHSSSCRRLLAGILGAGAALALIPSVSAQFLGLPGPVEAGTSQWTKLVNQPPFNTDSANLLTDGTVLVHQYNSPNWWRLAPDINGSYLNGTWTQAASMASDYAPLYFANVVLPDGRLLVEGGEYNFLSAVWTNKGAIYDPVANVWTTVAPPTGWANIGDSPGIVQPDGIFMLGQGGIATKKQALFDAATLTWTAVAATGKSDTFSEEGFGLLPDGRIMLVDTQNIPNSELYDPLTQTWTSAGSTGVVLADAGTLEIGPQIQLMDGNLLALGGTPHNAIFHPSTNTWTPTADSPGGNDLADGPCSVLPDGNVLIYASPGVFQGNGSFFIYDGVTFTPAPATETSGTHQSWQGRTLLLPTGEVMWLIADGRTKDVELYSSTGRPNKAWRPRIRTVARTLTRGSVNNVIKGSQFNGLTIGSDYGDDALAATNYPLVQITNQTTKHVFYARTHGHSTMAIATGSALVSTQFDVPAAMETGASSLSVIANGIASAPKAITIQ